MSINELLSVFANNILPIILLGGAGFALAKILHIESRSLGRVVFYIFSPVLIFDILIKNKLNLKEAAGVVGFIITIIFAMGGLTYFLGLLLKVQRPTVIASLVPSMFANTG